MQSASRLVLYSTIYPGVEKYLPAWYASVLAQTDRDFDIWIGIDGLDVHAVLAAIGAKVPATWIIAEEGDSPAQIRQRAIQRMITQYPAVIFVDSDDLLEPTRVEAAREYLTGSDVTGCAMRLIDEDGRDLGLVFGPPVGVELVTLLPRNNIFGLSNTVYRSKVLIDCLPIPARCVLVDWFLATRAWALGARLSFDFTCRMAYRQHPFNTARVLPPFTPEQVTLATKRVLDHYAFLLLDLSLLKGQYRNEVEIAYYLIQAFWVSITNSPEVLYQYVQALNQLPPNHIWWSYVAHPQLEEIWKN